MPALGPPTLEITPWRDDRRFAYSVTHDEGLVEILGFACAGTAILGFGHVNVFRSRLGRLEGDTSAGFLQSLWNLRKDAEGTATKTSAPRVGRSDANSREGRTQLVRQRTSPATGGSSRSEWAAKCRPLHSPRASTRSRMPRQRARPAIAGSRRSTTT